ncbi:MAG: response regulator [Lachnospiraceae bacterium]|nr:response regulator [Lachnospiraceae bacterium]
MDTNHNRNERETFMESQITLSIFYTIFSVAVVWSTLLNGTDLWTIPIVAFSVIAAWVLHVTQMLTEKQWVWLYVVFFNISYFYFSIAAQEWSDLTTAIVIIMVGFSLTSVENTINVCMIVYYASIILRIALRLMSSDTITLVDVSRYFFHFVVVFAAGFLIRRWISNRQRGFQQSQAILTELNNANKRTEDFLTNVSHELRTPINAVVGVSSVILREETDEKKRNDLTSIQLAGRRLFDQIEDILDYTEIDTDRLVVSQEPFSVTSMVADLIAEMRWREKENMPEMIFDIDPKMPVTLIGDERKLKKILRHLVGNAVKFTRRGGVCTRITFREEPYGINMSITVSDTGVGIDEEELGRITDKYYQSEMGRNRIAGGLGLGLSIVRGLAASMNGFMIIKSEKNRGTSVQVSIPHAVANSDPAILLPDAGKYSIASFLKPGRFSLPEVREFYTSTFDHAIEAFGCQFHRANQFEDFKRIVSAYHLTHVYVNNIDYEENLDFYLSLDPSIRQIILSDRGYELPEAAVNTVMLEKPFSTAKLAEILRASGDGENAENGKHLQMVCPGVRALVVDDEPMNLLVAQQIFRGYQMEVTTVNSGIKAIRACEKGDFDIIFMDHMMPEMDGVETMKRIRQTETSATRHIIIALTANAVSGAREMFLSEGMDEFISKPIETVELERVMKKLLPEGAIGWIDAPVPEKKTKKQDAPPAPEPEAEEPPMMGLFGETEPAPAADVPSASSEGISITSPVEYLELAGINTTAGIEYCKDEEFYLEMIAMFVESYDDKVESITDCYRKADWENYRILVHTLKSNSRMLGAEELSGLALHQEEAARDLNEPEIRAKHEELMSTFAEYTELFQKAMELAPAEGGDRS